jgi:hypothetical protein
VQYPRAIPFLLMLVAAAGTLYFNATHVPERVRLLALAVPVASILVTLGLAYLLKMLAAASGAAAIHLAPPALEPNRIVRHPDVLHGELVRDPEVPGLHGPAGTSGQLPWQHQQQAPQIPQNGHGELGEATKRQQIEAYLAVLDAGQLATTTRSQVAAELTAPGMPVDETYAGRILGEWRVRHPAAGSARSGGAGADDHPEEGGSGARLRGVLDRPPPRLLRGRRGRRGRLVHGLLLLRPGGGP